MAMYLVESLSLFARYTTHIKKTLLFILLLSTVEAYETIFMGHATSKPGYSYVCHQRTVTHTLGGQIDSLKEFYEGALEDCTILLTSPPGTLIDFRFTDIGIIASDLNTCQDASLNIYDGPTNATSLLRAFPNGLCGQRIPSFPIRSTSNTMLLKLRVTSPYTSRFSAIYTAFSSRTSVLCFYCGDLCLQNSQLCDGLKNCWGGEDEGQNCEAPPPELPSDSQDVEDLKLLLVLVLGSIVIIFMGIIIAIIINKKLKQSCLEKQRRRRAAAAANIMLHPPLPHQLAQRTPSGNSTGRTPVGLGFNRPFMAGPTVRNPASMRSRAPRSDMPPPYTTMPRDTETVMEGGTNLGGSQTNILAASRENISSENPALPHISDDEDFEQGASNANIIVNYTSSTREYNGGEIQTPPDIETSFIEEPTAPGATDDTAVNDIANDAPDVQLDINARNTVTDVSVVKPENEIDNSAVNVSSRDTIYVIESLNIEPINIDLDDGDDNEEVVYI